LFVKDLNKTCDVLQMNDAFSFQCNPNMTVYNVFIDCLDPRLPHIALFSNKDIAAGEELTFDYLMYKGETLALCIHSESL